MVYTSSNAPSEKPSMKVGLVDSQVTIPALPSQCFQPPKLCQSMEEAKNYAAEHVLLQLGVPLDAGAGTVRMRARNALRI